MLVENNFVILGSTRTVYTQQRKQQRGLLTKTMLLSLTADVRMDRNNLAFISAEHDRKKMSTIKGVVCLGCGLWRGS